MLPELKAGFFNILKCWMRQMAPISFSFTNLQSKAMPVLEMKLMNCWLLLVGVAWT